jgi:general secretion pathway protein F
MYGPGCRVADVHQIVLGIGLFVRDWWFLCWPSALGVWWFDRRRDVAFREKFGAWLLQRLRRPLVAKIETARPAHIGTLVPKRRAGADRR